MLLKHHNQPVNDTKHANVEIMSTTITFVCLHLITYAIVSSTKVFDVMLSSYIGISVLFVFSLTTHFFANVLTDGKEGSPASVVNLYDHKPLPKSILSCAYTSKYCKTTNF